MGLRIQHALLMAGAWVAAAAPARAWTEADVRAVRAEVDVAPDGGAHVQLELGVKVRRGWLEGLEVAGLDPDLELDPERPPWWIPVDDGDAEREPPAFEPDVRVFRDGRVQLRFIDRRSPRRGTYRAGFAYRTRLQVEPAADDRLRLRWTLPPWRSGLDDVEVRVHAPGRAHPAKSLPDAPSGVRVTRQEDADGTTLTFRRTHLPRTVAWPVAVEVPAGAMAPGLVPEAPERAAPPRAVSAAPPGDPAPR
ncbi:MAG: hypothetical protein ACODAU_10560, partial [Myxococcota bacterium]